MSITFKIIPESDYHLVIPLVEKLNNHKISFETLKERFEDMKVPNYECAGIYDNETLIGVCGMWFCTRHYSGRSIEVDHVFINPDYRGNGLGKQFFDWIYAYVKSKGYETMELNTYTGNTASHKFYYNEGFKILGFHFLKKL